MYQDRLMKQKLELIFYASFCTITKSTSDRQNMKEPKVAPKSRTKSDTQKTTVIVLYIMQYAKQVLLYHYKSAESFCYLRMLMWVCECFIQFMCTMHTHIYMERKLLILLIILWHCFNNISQFTCRYVTSISRKTYTKKELLRNKNSQVKTSQSSNIM